MSRYLVLNIDCAECRAQFETLVTVIGYADTLSEAKELTTEIAEQHKRHTWLRPWEECEGGWSAACGTGELRIIELKN